MEGRAHQHLDPLAVGWLSRTIDEVARLVALDDCPASQGLRLDRSEWVEMKLILEIVVAAILHPLAWILMLLNSSDAAISTPARS
jgi:hypothetical protein